MPTKDELEKTTAKAERARDKALKDHAHLLKKHQAEHNERVRLQALLAKAHKHMGRLLEVALKVPESGIAGSPANVAWVEARTLLSIINEATGGRDDKFERRVRGDPAEEGAGPGDGGRPVETLGSATAAKEQSATGAQGASGSGAGTDRGDAHRSGQDDHEADRGGTAPETGAGGTESRR
jgi:hypothetical protein